ncbi:MAG: T9SS type A sorting domain-containing protein [Bacteroidetes bacterium]|nr:T9SS type A sorting domain-containing protein [Bacteroidota bacterium]
MKKTQFTLFIMLMVSVLSFGQPLTGTKNIPGDYPTVTNAIIALNFNGVGSGGVTFVIAGGYMESFTSLTAGLITATGTVSDPITFQWSGTGVNPVITGYATGPNVYDYVIALQGSDYITFDGINVTDPTGVVEWGYAILKNSAGNGSQNVIIRNCNISLKSSTNVNTVGIYSADILPGTAPTALLTVSSTAGANSNNKFYANTITGCYNGIIVNGYNDANAPYAFYDQSNEIGKDGANTITGPGGGTAAASGIQTSYQERLVIANNIVNGTVANTTGAFGAIQLNTSKNSNVSVYNNSVSVVFNASSGTFYGIYNNMGTTYTNNIASFYNNTVSNCSSPNATSGSAYYLYINNSAQVLNVYNNNVLNNTYGSASTTSQGTTGGIYIFGSATTLLSADIHGNNFSNFTRYQSASGSGGATNCFWLGIGNSGATVSVYENVINNITTPTSGLLAGFYYLGGPGYKNLYGNTVTNLTSAIGNVYGCYLGEGYNQSIYRNKFQNLKTNGTGTSAYVYGIYSSGSSNGGPMYIYNNFVSELKAPNGSSGASGASSGGALCGIYGFGNGLTYLGIYNNTVFLDGTSSAGSFSTSAIFLSYNPAAIDLRNNVLINRCAPTSGGFAVALKSNGYSIYSAAIDNLVPATNNNLLYAGIPSSSHLIAMISNNDASYFVYDQSLNDYKTREWPKENSSITGMPAFVQISTSPYDIHNDPAVGSICESAGQTVSTPVSITNDFDNDARFPGTGYPNNPSYPAVAADLGADEFAGIPDDHFGPTILYTPLLNGTSTDERTLTATITDPHGVPTTGAGLPRLAWKKSVAGTWTYVTGVSTGNDQNTFTFGAGANTGDTVFYYVVAQDQFTTPNAGTFPLVGSDGLSVNPPAATTPPTPQNFYKITQGRCGVLTVGADKYYPTLTAAINDINTEGITCSTVLELTDNTYLNETYPIIINPIAGASATTTLTIRPAAGATPLLSCSYLGVSPNPWSQISLNGAQYVIFDGSNSGGSDRSMTIENTANGGFAAPIGFYNNGQVGAGNITIRNSVIRAHAEFIYNAQGIVFYTVVGNAGYHDVVIHNNEITSAAVALRLGGISSNIAQNVQVTNNTIGSPDPAKVVASRCITLSYIDNVLIEGNDIMSVADGSLAYPTPAPMIIQTGSGTSNLTIRKNKIHDLYNLGGGGGAVGIYLGSNTTTVTEISNNVLYNIKAVGSSQSISAQNPIGLMIQSGSNFKIVHNTIVMQGNYLGSTIPALSACVSIRNSITGIEFRDNILSNSSQQVSGTPVGHKSYCILVGTSPGFTIQNNNDYSVTGTGPVVGYYGATDRITLADWQTACGQDAASVSVDPVFTSTTNFLPTTTLMPKKGEYIPTLPIDFAGVVRTNPPDIGAYEFTAMPVPATTAATDILDISATLNGTINPNSLDVNIYFDYGPSIAYGTTVNGTPFTVNGGVLLNINAPVASLTANTTYHFRIRAVTFSNVTIYGNDMTFTTAPGIPENITVTGEVGETNINCYNAANTITVAGGGNFFNVQSGGSATFIAWQKISFLPGTTVSNGGYMHGYIAPGTYCAAPALPIMAAGAGESVPNTRADLASFSIFPNPTTGNFTLVQKGAKLYDKVNIELYSIHGEKVACERMIGEKSHDFGLSTMPAGLYFVKVVADGYVETIKLVKL